MTIEQVNVVDAIGVDKCSGEVSLTITDHLQWGEENADRQHCFLLQEKINAYLRFIESGEILENYPDAQGRDIVIDVVGKYPPGEIGERFLAQVSEVLAGVNIKLCFRVFTTGHT